jgi:flagellar biosynthesis protein FlhB
LYLAIKSLLPHLFGYLQTNPKTYGKWGMADMAGLMFKLILAFVFIALLDLMYAKWEFGKNMRMSRRELKEEIKQREGDPRIRARVRQLQNEMRKKAEGMRKLPKADVLITNPTHIAVALRYERGAMDAPQMVAKGAGELTVKMKEIARRHNIPIIENRRLARALFQKTHIDQTIPGDLFPEVAKLLVWVYAMRERRTGLKTA